jgi:hypothetical protein
LVFDINPSRLYFEKMQWQKQRTTAPGRLRNRGFGKVDSYIELQRRYRIDHYHSGGEQPYIALIVGGTGRNKSQQISRHATLEESQAACEQHLR